MTRSPIKLYTSKAGWRNGQPVAEWDLSSAGRASALQAEGHSPIGPISLRIFNMRDMCGRFARVLKVTLLYYGEIAQLARAYGSYP